LANRPSLFVTGAVVLALLGGLAGGYSWYWYQLADGIQDGLKVWLGKRRAEGFQAEAGPIGTSGFPFDIELTVGVAVLGRGTPNQARSWHWQGRQLQARLSPFEPWRIHLATRAAQNMTFTESPGKPKKLRVQADDARGVIEIGPDGRLARILTEFEIIGLSGNALPGPVAAQHLTMESRLRGADANYAIDVSLQADAVQLPANTDPVLGDAVDVARLDATLSGPPPRSWADPAIRAWRDDGGTIDVTRARIKWGPLDATSVGTIALDQEMRPLISATAGLKDYDKTIKAYKKAAFITPLNAAALTIALNMLRRDAEGRIKIAVTGQNGRLKVGPVNVARLRPLRFPAE